MSLERHHYGNINTSLQNCSNSPSGGFFWNMNGLFNLLIKHQKEETIILCFCFVIQRWTFRSLPCYTTHVCFTALLLQDFLVQSRLHGSSVSASPGPEAAKQLQTSRPTTIMFDLWHNVFFYENILHQMEWDSSLPNISAFVLSVHRIFSQRLAKGFVFGKTL